jgi:hypothetical protein
MHFNQHFIYRSIIPTKKNVNIVELLQNEYNRNWKSILTTLVNGFFGFQIILILFIYMRDFGLVVLSD